MKHMRIGSCSLAILSAILGLALCAGPAQATIIWTNTAGSWDVAGNWSPNQVPTDGDDVVITNTGASVLLSGASSNLSSLVISKTLTFTNWSTSLTATNLSIQSGGKLTCAGPFTESQMSNRVYLVCSNLLIALGGSIDVKYLGWAAGAANSAGNGPGKGGWSYDNYGPGAAHGGRGGYGVGWANGGLGAIYGSAQNPVDPGSGSGSPGASGRSGHGGGAVRINASGTVTVNGTIIANGESGITLEGAGGSGGSVWITCKVFSGTNGSVEAQGGGENYYAYAGVGGGGRISVEYNPDAQAAANVPSVRFVAKPGTTYYGDAYRFYESPSTRGDLGTLYFPDNRLLLAPAVEFSGLWMAPGTNIVLDVLHLTNGWLRFRGENLNLTVSNNIVVDGASAKLDLGGNGYVTNAISYVGYYYNTGLTSGPTLTCGGNMILTNGGGLCVFGGMTNADRAYGAYVGVAGTLYTATNSTILPFSHGTNGGSPIFKVGSVRLAAGASVAANGLGFMAGQPYATPSGNKPGYGPGHGTEWGGAGYGGAADPPYAGGTYGSSNAPVDPGSGGGTENNIMVGGNGGGLVRIESAGSAEINGAITANGFAGNDGGGSGGGVYIRCKTFSGSTGSIQASGGGSLNSSGGGGRIAVARITDSPSPALVTAAASGGTGTGGTGYTGTVVWVTLHPPVISNSPPANVTVSSASLVGYMVATGDTPATVYCFWGAANGGTNAASWATNDYLGIREVGFITNTISGLTGTSRYYYAFYASNSIDGAWATPSTTFSTPGAPTVGNGEGADQITATSARLRGRIVVGSPAPLAYICWGDNDPGVDSTSAWDTVISMDVQEADFSQTVSGLLANKPYFYRCYAINENGGAWAPTATNFTAAQPTISIGDVLVVEGSAGSPGGPAIFTLTLSAASYSNVTVAYQTANGTAMAGSDYTAASGVATFNAGETTQTVAVTVLGDSVDEYPSENFMLNLSAPANATLANSQGVATIVDDDEIPEDKFWGGNGTWTDSTKWTPGGWPSPGDRVFITNGNCLIDNSEIIASLEVTNGATLVFSNWTTRLTVGGDVKVLSGGKLTCAGPFTESQMSNRVYIVCTNLTVDSNASIDVNYRGWAAGAPNSAGNGPGKGGWATDNYGPGAAYGGRGGRGLIDFGGLSKPYGSAQNPVDPGSGSGSSTSYRSGHGGGAVRIDASGTVTVNGTISANGEQGAQYYGAGGSGGGIWITCNRFAGTTGSVEAKGGGDAYNANAGVGGGGRISVEYNPGSQASAAIPSVRFLTDPGVTHNSGAFFGIYQSPSTRGDMGTLYFPDHRFLMASPVQNSGLWMAPGTNIVLSQLYVSNACLRLNGENLNLTVSNNIVVDGTTAKLDLGGNGCVTNTIGEAGYYYNTGLTSGPTLNCGGSLILTNGGGLCVFGGMTNADRAYGAYVGVAGALYAGSSSAILPFSHGTNGGSPMFKVGSVSLASNASITANGLGYMAGQPHAAPSGSHPGYGPGHGIDYGGGGYGGRAGGSLGGGTYGSSNAPIYPGTGGGTENHTMLGGNGGGLIRIESAGTADINGTITANGVYGGDGGGSGGGVYIKCRIFAGSTGSIQASGGSSLNSSGGGGRIAVWRMRDNPSPRLVTASAVGGSGGAAPVAETGTVVWGLLPTPGTIISLR